MKMPRLEDAELEGVENKVCRVLYVDSKVFWNGNVFLFIHQ